MKPTTPAILLSEAEHLERLRRARPDRLRQFAAGAALVLGVMCLLAEMYRIQTAVDSAAQAHISPISYEGKFVPDKPVFRPGEDATFHFVRIADFTGPELFVQGLSSFENNDTGVSYTGGPSLKRLQERDRGRHEGTSVRTIPANAKPGKHYTYEGQVTAQGAYRTLPVGFCSEPFEIRSWLSEQEKAQYDQEQAERRAKSDGIVSLDGAATFAGD